LEISEQRIADHRIDIVSKGQQPKSWLEVIQAQVAETFKETNVNTEEETTQPTDENEQKKEPKFRTTTNCRKPRTRQRKNRILQGTKRT